MRRILYSYYLLAFVLLAYSCSSSTPSNKEASQTEEAGSVPSSNDILTGEMTIIVDEAVFPIINEQMEVFKSSYTNSNFRLLPLPEREAINAIIQGKGAMGILARELSDEENAGFKQRNIKPKVFPIFYDGVVFVNNIASPDTSITIHTLKSLLNGENTEKLLLFDNLNSSMVRRIKEYAKVDKISAKSVKPLTSSEELLTQLAENNNQIGVLSYGQYLDYRRKFGEANKFRILSLQTLADDGTESYFKPSQTTFATDEYALKTTFYVLNYQPNMGLGIGFSAFLTGDRGQRVALKAGILPATMPGREIIIRDNIN